MFNGFTREHEVRQNLNYLSIICHLDNRKEPHPAKGQSQNKLVYYEA